MKSVRIADREIGPGRPCFIIAEAGVNHNGRLDLALQLIDVAVEAGVDAVKFQTFKAERLTTADAPAAEYQKRSMDAQESQLDMLKRLELSESAHVQLMNHCRGKGIIFLSSPFEEESADFLEKLGLVAFKMPSGEITNLPLLQHVARKGRPIILSTGMATLDEVRSAVETIHSCGQEQLIVLHCVSNYPASAADANLRAMHTLSRELSVPVGFSDHTEGLEVALAAVALGACLIEKHFTLNRNLPGPDHQASLLPDELRNLVSAIRKVESSLGDGRKQPAASESNTAAVARKSLAAARDIPRGTILTEDLLALRRPGTGLPPARRKDLLGRRTRTGIKANTLLSLDLLE